MTESVVIVDYGAGNITSVSRALQFLDVKATISCAPTVIASADRIIFPGVGSAAHAMSSLDASGVIPALKTMVESGKPFLGICLGAQIALRASDEGDVACLGLVDGVTTTLAALYHDQMLKIPHMGWNTVRREIDHPIFFGIPNPSYFYFVHAYYTNTVAPTLSIGSTEYGSRFTTAYAKKNIVGVQFHPEKSGPVGLQLLRNFMNWRP